MKFWLDLPTGPEADQPNIGLLFNMDSPSDLIRKLLLPITKTNNTLGAFTHAIRQLDYFRGPNNFLLVNDEHIQSARLVDFYIRTSLRKDIWTFTAFKLKMGPGPELAVPDLSAIRGTISFPIPKVNGYGREVVVTSGGIFGSHEVLDMLKASHYTVVHANTATKEPKNSYHTAVGASLPIKNSNGYHLRHTTFLVLDGRDMAQARKWARKNAKLLTRLMPTGTILTAQVLETGPGVPLTGATVVEQERLQV